jgi:hypothetical protein
MMAGKGKIFKFCKNKEIINEKGQQQPGHLPENIRHPGSNEDRTE